MIRSRDFFLFVSIIVFLVVAIGATVVGQYEEDVAVAVATLTEDSENIAREATVASKEPDREARLAVLREKIAAGATLFSQDSFFEADTIATSTNPDVAVSAEMLCAGYAPYAGFWDLREVAVEETATSRTVKRIVASASSSEEVLLTLPRRSTSSGAENCLKTDVVGVTIAGALLRNSDAVFYRGVSDAVLLGYALDGFPIYGTSNLTGDTCGGVSVDGQYRYVLNAERATMLNCFSATPATL